MKLTVTAFALLTTVILSLEAETASAQTASPDLKESMTAGQFERADLHKLTPEELTALEQWISTNGLPRADHPVPASPQKFAGGSARKSDESAEELVAFNQSSRKYHCSSCQWASRCTRNCVDIPLSQAKAGGVPCSVCGGSCR